MKYYAYFSAKQAVITEQVLVYKFRGKEIRVTLLSPVGERHFEDSVLLAKGHLEDFIFMRREKTYDYPR